MNAVLCVFSHRLHHNHNTFTHLVAVSLRNIVNRINIIISKRANEVHVINLSFIKTSNNELISIKLMSNARLISIKLSSNAKVKAAK